MSNSFKKTIWVTYTLDGLHFWSNAPEDVEYLKNLHRHLFHFKVALSVTHTDRDYEYHQVMKICKFVSGTQLIRAEKFGWSCEKIAEILAEVLMEKYNLPIEYVEVSEDGECGSIVYV